MSTIDNISKFWWLKQYIEDCGYNVGHSLFSIGHLLWLIIIAFLSIYTLNYYKNASNTKKILLKKMLAIIILVLEYVKFIVVGFLFPNYVNMYLPLHLCSFAGIAIIIEAIFGRNKTLDQMWLYVFLPASLLGVLSPSTSLPFLNFFSIHTYLFHGILVLFALIKICCDGIKVRYSGLVESNLILICMVIPIYYLNRLFGTNYFIISDASDFPLAQTIWNAVVPKLGEFGYILGMFVVAFCIFNIIYLILICVRYLKKKK